MASIGILIAIIVYLVMMVYVDFILAKGKARKIQRTIFIWVEDSWDRS